MPYVHFAFVCVCVCVCVCGGVTYYFCYWMSIHPIRLVSTQLYTYPATYLFTHGCIDQQPLKADVTLFAKNTPGQ